MTQARHTRIAWSVALAGALFAAPATARAQTVLYVDANAPPGGDGLSWTNAFNDLQDALDGADEPNSGVTQIWVASGTYTPDRGTGDRNATFQLVAGVAIYGGFPSGGGMWDGRDPNANETILSGDLNGDDEPNFINYDDNAHHVATGDGTDPTATLDGFTITAGNADGAGFSAMYGAGVYNDDGSPTVSNCIFTRNTTRGYGGGVYNTNGSAPTLANCTFNVNSAYYLGGAIHNDESSPILNNCVFAVNSADTGGAVSNYYGSPTMRNCTFTGHSSTQGGAVDNYYGAPTMVNCVFADNFAISGGAVKSTYSTPTLINCIFNENVADYGGAVNSSASNPSLMNCAFTGNSALRGGGMYNFACASAGSVILTNCTFASNVAGDRGAGIYSYDTALDVTNSVFWNNSVQGNTEEASQIYGDDPNVNYCCIQGLTGNLGGTGNIGDGPMFVRDPDDGGDGWGVGENDDLGDLHLMCDSPCLDTADSNALPEDIADLDGDANTTEPIPIDLDGNDRILGDDVDMGAYEGANQGFIVVGEPVTVPEANYATFEITLACDLQELVVVTVTHHSGDLDITVSDPPDGTLTFEPNEPNATKVVTLFAGQDPDFTDGTAVIRISSTGITDGYVRVKEADNDSAPNQPILFVDSRASGANNGTSWADAFTDLQCALFAAAHSAGVVNEIWIAAGTYHPVGPGGNRSVTFQLLSGVAMYGGFSGGETQLAQRDVATNLTILSGDLNGDDGPDFANNVENSYHVVTGSGTDETAILDGVTITAGSADGSAGYHNDVGGGIYNSSGSPIVTNCVVSRNHADSEGGGIYNSSSYSTVTNCKFIDNRARSGAGVYNYFSGPTPEFRVTLKNSVFVGNAANVPSGYGGGLYNRYFSSALIVNCQFIANSAGSGGGVYNSQSSPVLKNCVFAGNWTGSPTVPIGDGGAMCNGGGSPMIINCTLVNNSSSSGGGIHNRYQSSPALVSCLLWGNSALRGRQISLESALYPSAISVSFSNLQGGQEAMDVEPNCVVSWRNGNIDVDPLLTPDGHLQTGSPCIDAGDPNAVLDPNFPNDIDGDVRVVNGRADMGADEFLDTDVDRLPDWLEPLCLDPNGGGDPNTAAAPSADRDGDGLINVEEYVQYSSNPNAPAIYVDINNPADPNEDGSVVHPFDTIQEGINIAGDGDTVVVAQGTYLGPGNTNLDYKGKGVVVRAPGGPAMTTIDCNDAGRAVDYETLGGVFAVLEGFTITGGSGDLGGGIRAEQARLLLKRCELAGNSATTEGGGLYSDLSSLTFDQLLIGSNRAGPSEPNAGVISFSNVYLEGDLTLQAGRLDVLSSWFDGPNTFHLEPNTILRITGGPGAAPTMIRSDVAGHGDILIEAGQKLIFDANAVVDLSGGAGCNPDPNDPTGGLVTVEGALVVQGNATIRNTKVDVNVAEFDGDNDIINNNIALLEASTGYGGQFFVGGNAIISCNTIVSEGDRYLDLDPDPDSPNRPTITNNEITVIIKQGTLGSQGTLLELRARDYDCGGPNNPDGESGAFQVPPSSPGFTADPSENWVLEEMCIDPNAKVNLTNRQGFVYQDDANYPETVYVKKLKLCENAVLNTGLQTLYYQTLVDQNDTEIVRDPNQPNGPFANGSRITDVPMMGFSLAIIAMEDTTEFGVRVRKRLRDPNDDQPPEPPFKEGAIERLDDVTHGGLMQMRTQDPSSLSASSVAAVGAFARAAEDEITVAFEYLFRQDPSGDAYLTVYLTDRHSTDANAVAVAHVYPPAYGRRGAVGSDELAVFRATMPRGDFNFTRGTYVKIELHGDDAVCWIDNWDPYIECTDECASMDGLQGVSEADYLLLLVAATGQELPSQWCADVTGDGYLDIIDLLSWDAYFSEALNLCPTPPPPLAGSEAGGKAGSFSVGNSFGGEGSVLVIAGKSCDPSDYQYDFLYTLDPNDSFAGQKQSPTCPGHQCDTGNGRLLTDSSGTLYQVHGLLGLMHREHGTAIVGPDHTLTYNEDPNLGDSDVWVGIADQEGLPLTDAVFDRRDSKYVYVVPVTVHRPGGAGDPYKAVAKLEILGDPNDGNYDLVGLYGKDPNDEPNKTIDPLNGTVTLETDVWQVREVDVDGYGNVFVLSAQAWNDNDWVLIYDEAVGNPNEVRVLLKDVLGAELEAPTALHVSCDDTTLWLASAKNAPDASSTQVYRFTIDRSGTTATGLTSAGSVEITNMRHVTSMTEDPATGTVYVMGVMAPTFDPEAGNPDADTPIFTWPTLAVVPDGAGGPVAATEVSSEDPSHDLALPLSVVFVPAATCYTLTVKIDNPSRGSVTVEPNLGCYAPNAPVLLTAEPLGNKQFKKWKVWDAYDPNITAIDTNNPLTIDMVADRQVKAFFKCGGGGIEEGLPLLATFGVLGLYVLARRSR